MDAQRYQQVKAILVEALDLSGSARDAYLASACGHDRQLRAEVESLLAHESEEDFLAPVVQPRADAPAAIDALEGTVAAHYRVTRRLQSGGMGVVYLAEDLRLGRPAALKFLRPDLLFEPQAKARFMREATAIAALTHPNICTLYGVEETADGQLFMAMAYYEGETLRERLMRGRLPVPASVDIARQIASGLAVAHAAGIIHRDIKPANILITDGVVKVLDFGIAKLTDQSRLTLHGASPGTPDYMSPEQQLGEGVDDRADVWSLGVVMHEMLWGRLPGPPPVVGVRGDVPAGLEAVVQRALAPRPSDRYQSMRELVDALDHVAVVQGRRVVVTVMPVASAYDDDASLADVVTEGLADALSCIPGFVVDRPLPAGVTGHMPRRPPQPEAVLAATLLLEAGQVGLTAAARRSDGRVLADFRVQEPIAKLARAVVAIARELSRAFGVSVTAEDERHLDHRGRAESNAYLAYLRGRRCLLRETVDGAAEASMHFESVLVAAPDALGPLPHAGIVEGAVQQVEHGGERDEVAGTARRALDAALRLDATAADVQFAAAELAYRIDGSPAEAEGRLRRVLAQRPGHTRAAIRLAECVLATGNDVEAAEIARDVGRSRLSSIGTRLRAGRVLHLARHYRDAADVLGDAVRAAPHATVGRFDLAATLAKREDFDGARAECDRALAGHEGQAIMIAAVGNAAKARGEADRHDACRRALRRLEQQAPVPAVCFALLDIAFGNTGRPIEYLDGYDAARGLAAFLGFVAVNGSVTRLVSAVGLIAYLGVDPAFDCLYDAAGFSALAV